MYEQLVLSMLPSVSQDFHCDLPHPTLQDCHITYGKFSIKPAVGSRLVVCGGVKTLLDSSQQYIVNVSCIQSLLPRHFSLSPVSIC